MQGIRSAIAGRSGFTLLEIIMVIIIIGVLAAIALPSYTGFTERARVAEAVNGMAAVKSAVLAQRLELSAWPAAQGTATDIAANLGVTLNTTNWGYKTEGGATTATKITATRTSANGGTTGQYFNLTLDATGPGTWDGNHPSRPR